MGCMGVSQTKTAIVTPFDQAWELTKTVPVRVGHVITINSEGVKTDTEIKAVRKD